MPKRNIAYSKRTRDHGMKVIHSYFARNPGATDFSPSVLHNYGLRKSIDAERIVHVLGGLGYLNYELDGSNGHHIVKLTKKGICYFEQRRDDRYQLFIRSILIPIIVSLATYGLTHLVTSAIEALHIGTEDTMSVQTQVSEPAQGDLQENRRTNPTPTLESSPSPSSIES